MRQFLLLSLLVVGLAACSKNHPQVVMGQPEMLLDVSSERISLDLNTMDAIDELTDWVNQDQPTIARLACNDEDLICIRAKEVFNMFAVEVEHMPSSANAVELVYDRITVRDCDNRFFSNHRNGSNLNHPAFGCSTAVNIVQMVTDKQEFANPTISDPQDAEKAVATFREYLQ